MDGRGGGGGGADCMLGTIHSNRQSILPEKLHMTLTNHWGGGGGGLQPPFLHLYIRKKSVITPYLSEQILILCDDANSSPAKVTNNFVKTISYFIFRGQQLKVVPIHVMKLACV